MCLPSTRTLATRLSQLAAVWLLVLIAAPFTAPFATCELNDAVIAIALDDDGCGNSVAAKILLDTALPVYTATPGTATDALAVFVGESATFLSSLPQSSPLPLRL